MNKPILQMQQYSDEYYMKEALKEAYKARDLDEIPVGAVIVCNYRIIARAHNLVERLNDPTAHAEMQAFTVATNCIGGKYLTECILYVTLEPCIMCAGASFWTRIGTIKYGADDEKRGYSRLNSKILHPDTIVQGGILKKECSRLLKDYFSSKRE